MSLTVVVVVLSAVLFSAFFSGMEIAFVASNKLKVELDKSYSKTTNYILSMFTASPGQYITTMLVGNNIALVVYSIFMTRLTYGIGEYYGIPILQGSILIDTVASTIIILFLADYIPKAIVSSSPNFFLKTLARPAYLFYLLLYPIAKFSTWVSIGIMKIFGMKLNNEETKRAFDRVDLAYLIEEATERMDGDDHHKQKSESEIKIFQNALDFSDLHVRDCMVPRIDMVGADSDISIKELTAKFIESQFSRIFIYEGSIDNIIGYINLKSLFNSPETLEEAIIEVDYVPESMAAQKLLSQLIKRKRNVAVVIDEFGGTAGMVSLEDILEEIFGEIEDEHDSPEMIEKQVGKNLYVFSCRLEVEYLNEKYNLGIRESDEYDTLGGFIIFHNEGIPSQGEEIMIDDFKFKLLKVTSSRVELARLEKVHSGN